MTNHQHCAFCEQQAPLRESHVLPAFVFRWLRGRSGTGHIRNTETPNRRVQDGLKLTWLCDDCEGQFSLYETAFATKVFHPWHAGQQRVAYEDWMLKFCVSVSWRVLKFARGHSKENNYTPEQERLLDQAEERWRQFLIGAAPHPAEFEQHLLVFDLIADTSATGLPPNFNRFLTGAITLDIVGSAQSLMTFAKMGRFVVFGIIQKGPNRWEGTRISVRRGVLQSGRFVVPAGILDLLIEKATHISGRMASMSPAQLAKIEQHIDAHPEQFAASEQFKAMSADAEMFGRDAVIRRVKSDGED